MLSQHSKKHHHTDAANVVPEPLVDPGNPSHRHQARSAAHLDRPCSRLVALAAGSPGRCSSRPSQKENATVMLRSNAVELQATANVDMNSGRIRNFPPREDGDRPTDLFRLAPA